MNRSPSLLRVSLFLIPLFLFAAGHAKDLTVAQVLSVKSPVVALSNGSGVVVDEVQRSWLIHTVAVVQSMAQIYELPVPKMVIVKGSSPNAFVEMRDGEPLLAVNTDILRVVGDDEDLIAAYIGHEFGHLKAGHLTQGHGVKVAVAVVGLILGAALDDRIARKGVDSYGLGTQAGTFGAGLVSAKFSRNEEREADDLGIRHMAKAGYDPSAVPRFWRLMEARGGGGSGLWLSSHPGNKERLRTMQTVAASLTDIYAANKSARVIAARETASRIPVVLGVVTAPMPVTSFGIEGVDGAMVTAVAPQSAGAAAGIKVGDILLRVDGKAVNEPDDVKTAIAAIDGGSAVDVRLMRKALPIWVSVQF